MKSGKRTRVGVAFLVGLALLLAVESVPSGFCLSAKATTVTSESIQEKEEQIEQAKEEKEALEGNISDIQDTIDQLESLKSDLSAYIAQLDQTLAELTADIASLKSEISDKEAEIEETEQELLAAQETAGEQYEAMKVRIRFMYEAQISSSFFNMLMTAESVGDLLNTVDYISRLYEYDQEMWEEYLAVCDYIELCRQQLEAEKELLEVQKANLETEEASLTTLLAEKNAQITEYETQIASSAQSLEEYEAEIAAQEEVIAALEKAVEEEKEELAKQNAASSVLTYDGGTFKFPLATYTRISDDYGWRIHPITGLNQFHNGVDFAAPAGTAIYAAYDGTVVAAAYSSTMGNYVMINHGDGLYTIYMHASALYVSAGDWVSRGDTIAAVGSTGRSTGNHLHFSVRKDGEYVSPWNYLSQ